MDSTAEYMSPKEVADRLGVSVMAVFIRGDTGKIPGLAWVPSPLLPARWPLMMFQRDIVEVWLRKVRPEQLGLSFATSESVSS